MHARTDVRLDGLQATGKSITVGAFALNLHQQGFGRIQFEKLVETVDRIAVKNYCGPKYERGNGEKRYQRAGTATRTIVTVLGRSEVTLSYIKDTQAPPDENTYFRPIEEKLEFNGQKRYQRCICFEAATIATKNSYRDAATIGHRLVPPISPATINRRVMEYGPQLREKLQEQTEGSSVETVIPDGTKVHSQADGDAFHDVNITLSRDGVGEAFQTTLLDVNVNDSWARTATTLDERSVIAPDAAIVSDGESPLVRAFCTGDRIHQFDLVHLPRSLGHLLWDEGTLPLSTRKAYASEVLGDALHLKNSVAHHAPAGELDAISHRIESINDRLDRTSHHLELDGCGDAAAFIRKWKPSVVQFAEAAIDGRTIPWTSNVVERAMGEVSKRCKNQWMRWTEPGLEALVTMNLVRYAHADLYEEFVANQIGMDAATSITIEVESRVIRDEF